MTSTYAVVQLDITPAAYEEIAEKMRKAYGALFFMDKEGKLLDMQGIALAPIEEEEEGQ